MLMQFVVCDACGVVAKPVDGNIDSRDQLSHDLILIANTNLADKYGVIVVLVRQLWRAIALFCNQDAY